MWPFGSVPPPKPSIPPPRCPPSVDTKPAPPAAVLGTLDELWDEAEKYGRPQLERKYSDGYEANISFSSKAGSSIRAKGEGDSPALAMQRVIREAQVLSAGLIMADD